MRRLTHILDMIKFEHTLFALPFALLSLFLASEGVPSPATLGWVLLAMLGARSSAMTMNRIADRGLDADNPRTRERHLPLGLVRLRDAWIFALATAALFVAAAWRLNRLALALSPVALAVLWSYSWTKRFTWASPRPRPLSSFRVNSSAERNVSRSMMVTPRSMSLWTCVRSRARA